MPPPVATPPPTTLGTSVAVSDACSPSMASTGIGAGVRGTLAARSPASDEDLVGKEGGPVDEKALGAPSTQLRSAERLRCGCGRD